VSGEGEISLCDSLLPPQHQDEGPQSQGQSHATMSIGIVMS